MIRDITIHAVLNGFTVQVGCQTVVFNDLKEMLRELKRYYKNPGFVEESYRNLSMNSRKLVDGAPTRQHDGSLPVAEYGGIPVRQYTYPARPLETAMDFARPIPDNSARYARQILNIDDAMNTINPQLYWFQQGGIPQPPPLGASGISQDTYIEVLRAMIREAEERRATGAADEG